LEELKTIRQYVRHHYGNLVTFDQPRLSGDSWSVNLKVDYPTIIDDDKTEERIIRLLTFKGIGHLQFDSKLRPLDATSREDCAKHLDLHLEKWKERTERIVVEATAQNLARVGRIREALHPMYVIVHRIATKGKITRDEIEEMRRPERKLAYVNLLSQDGIIRPTDDGYTYGNTYVSLLKKIDTPTDVDKVMETVVAFEMEQNYSVIREIFRVNRLDPFVHMDACYYRPSLEAGKLLHFRQETLISIYNSIYNPFSPAELELVIHELERTGIFHTTPDGFKVGSQDALDLMQQKKAEFEELALVA
jgi:predicted transcriptional regulator